MTKRIFVTVTRGMTDKTAVCVYPWEKTILEQIHGGEVAEVSLDDMCSLKGAISVQKNQYKRQDGVESEAAPDLRAQLVAMATVPEDEDPLNDPETEYNRLADKYGMDKDMPLPVVSRVYGEFRSGAFEAAIKEGQAKVKAAGEMSINELRTALRAADIDFDKSAKKAELADLLETATA